MEQNKFYQIKNVTEHEYTLVGCDGSVIIRPIQDVDKSASVFTIQDAKDGDVLATENFIFIFKNIDNGNGVHYYCHYEIRKHEDDSQFGVALPQSLMGRVGNSVLHYSPATKEQRDLLFSKMKEAGYEWYTEHKQLKKIEQKPAWSEEDESNLQGIIDEIKANKNHAPAYDLATYNRFLSWLKSLKDRYTWKPSENELEVLRLAAEKDGTCLMGLYENLKKLREE